MTKPAAHIMEYLSDPERVVSEDEQLAREAAESALTRDQLMTFHRGQQADHLATGSYEPWPGAYEWHTANPQDGSESPLDRSLRDY